MASHLPLLFSFLLVLVAVSVECANILMLHPVVSRSHELVFVTIGEALVQRGHNVTVVRFKGPNRRPSALLHTVALQLRVGENNTVPYLNRDGVVEPPHDLLWRRSRTIQAIPLDIIEPVALACDTLLAPETLDIFTRGTKYDVALIDILFNECALALVHHLGIPAAAYWPTIQHSGELFWTSGSILNPSFVPAMMSELSDRMSFVQRFVNTLWYVGSRMFSSLVMLSPAKNVITKHLPLSPPPEQLLANLSLLMVNSDFNLDFARPLPPNTIYIGCVQCRPPKPLDHELEQWMQSSGTAGVVVFSLGATFSEGGMPLAVVEHIYKAFARCPQKFILKMASSAPFTPVPSNVRLVDWLPQQDILGHSQTKLFITHCGMHGVLESLYHGVPMVGIPIFGDQGDVLLRLQLKGVAYGVDKYELTEDTLYNAIQTVLNNDSYRENAETLSVMLRDQPQTAMERTMYWIEYVIRHKGAEHLKSSDRFLNIFQYLLVDVVFAFAVLSIPFVWLSAYLSRKVFARWTKPASRRQNQPLKKKLKNK